MAKLLFKLNNVPDDEAEDIRELLDAHEIAYYETLIGRWGVGVAAIWLNESTEFEKARALIDNYQLQRYMHSQEELAMRQDNQKVNLLQGLLHHFSERPVHFLMTMIAIMFVLFLSLYPFLIFFNKT